MQRGSAVASWRIRDCFRQRKGSTNRGAHVHPVCYGVFGLCFPCGLTKTSIFVSYRAPGRPPATSGRGPRHDEIGAEDQSRRKRANETTLKDEGKKLWSRAHAAQIVDGNPPATTHKTFSPFDQMMPKKRAAIPTEARPASSAGKRPRPDTDRQVMVVNPGEPCRRCGLDFCPGVCMWCKQRCGKLACSCEKAFYCEEATCSRSHWKKVHKKECADRIKRQQQAKANKSI